MVNGITCSACVWLVEQHLNRQDGIAQCQVNLSSHRARVVWNPGSTSLSRIIRAIAQVGYKAEPYHPVQQEGHGIGESIQEGEGKMPHQQHAKAKEKVFEKMLHNGLIIFATKQLKTKIEN